MSARSRLAAALLLGATALGAGWVAADLRAWHRGPRVLVAPAVRLVVPAGGRCGSPVYQEYRGGGFDAFWCPDTTGGYTAVWASPDRTIVQPYAVQTATAAPQRRGP